MKLHPLVRSLQPLVFLHSLKSACILDDFETNNRSYVEQFYVNVQLINAKFKSIADVRKASRNVLKMLNNI